MRFAISFLALVSIFFSPSAAQEPKKEDDRPKFLRGGIIKRIEDFQDRLKKDRETRRKEQESERREAILARDEKIRLLNERIEQELRRAGLDRTFDPFATNRKKQNSTQPGPQTPPPVTPGYPRKQRMAGSSEGPLSLGVEVRPAGITSNGLLVEKVVNGSPAAKAGFRMGDRIIAVGGSPIKKLDELRLIMSAFEPGDRTEVEIMRRNQLKTLLVEFPTSNPQIKSLADNDPTGQTEELPLPRPTASGDLTDKADTQRTPTPPPILPSLKGPEQSDSGLDKKRPSIARSPGTDSGFRAGIGVTAVAVDPVLFDRKQLSVRQGAYLEEIETDSAAAKAGLKPGDVIIALDGRKVDSAVGMAELVQTYQPGDKAQLLYYRKNQLKRTAIQLDAIPFSEQDKLIPQIRNAENLSNRSKSSSSRRNSILGDLSDEFPRLRKVEEMIDRFGGKPQDNRGASQNPVPPGSITGNGREIELETEVNSLRTRLKNQDRQIQELTEKLSLIEKLISKQKDGNQPSNEENKQP